MELTLLTLKVTVVTMCVSFLINYFKFTYRSYCMFCVIVNKQPGFIYSAIAKCSS